MSDGASEVWPPEQAPYYAHPGEPPAVARLSSTQAAALRAMVAGKPLNQAAADAGVDGRHEEPVADTPPTDVNSLAILQAEASDVAYADSESLQDAAAVTAQPDEPLRVKAPEPQATAATGAATPLLPSEAATPPATSEAAAAPVIASIVSGVIQKLTLADAIRMQDELEAMDRAEMDAERAAVVEHKAAPLSNGFAADDASQNRGKCCKTLQDDAADG